MFRHYLLTTLRNLKKQWGYTLINILGLALGMCCCILILMFVKDELSYDKYHEQADNIYRLQLDAEIGGSLDHFAVPPFAASPTFAAELPEIKAEVRMINTGGQLIYGDKRFEEDEAYLVDTAFFDIFTYEFIQGDPATVLDKPGSVVFTKEAAERMFGKQDPVGESFKIDEDDYFVAGIIKEVPRNSHFHFDFVVSMNSLQGDDRRFLSLWLNIGAWSYFLLEPGTDPRSLEAKFPAIVDTHTGEDAARAGMKLAFQLQKLTDIHLHSHLQAEMEGNSDITYVYIFSAVSIFILFIACINFINLATARASSRAREVGVRKTAGATRGNVIRQFLGESMVMATISLSIALLGVIVALPFFNDLAQKEMMLSDLFQPEIIMGVLGMLFITGILAGSYPAFVLSSFQPMAVIRGTGVGSGKSLLRKVLVIVQFSISVMLIIGTLIVIKQIDYLKNKSLGFEKEQMLVVRMRTDVSRESFPSVRNEMLAHTDILEAAFSSVVPGDGGELRLFLPEGNDRSETHVMDLYRVDFDFVSTFGMEITQGRDFSSDLSTDSTEAFIINETAARKLGWPEDAVGKEFEFLNARTGKIVGVVKDFHFTSLTEEISPVVFMVAGRPGFFLSLKIRPENTDQVVDHITQVWEKFDTQRPLDYYFVSEDFASRYETEERTGKIVGLFSTLAILIAALGVLGLASFMAATRTREIGIRKILGAPARSLYFLLSKEFAILVLISNLIAWPGAYYLLKNYWLLNFPYATDFTGLSFVIAGGLSILITALAISYQTTKVITSNPVEALRYE